MFKMLNTFFVYRFFKQSAKSIGFIMIVLSALILSNLIIDDLKSLGIVSDVVLFAIKWTLNVLFLVSIMIAIKNLRKKQTKVLLCEDRKSTIIKQKELKNREEQIVEKYQKKEHRC